MHFHVRKQKTDLLDALQRDMEDLNWEIERASDPSDPYASFPWSKAALESHVKELSRLEDRITNLKNELEPCEFES